MENYFKGKNEEEPLEKEKIPIPNLPPNFLWMQVRGGTKMKNVLTHALNEFPDVSGVVWTGFGPAVGKTISCAEIMKRELNNSLHQITKICYRTVKEYWDPKLPELDQLVVTRKLPMIHILLSREPLNTNEPGYQAPGMSVPFKGNTNRANRGTPKPRNSRANPAAPAPDAAERRLRPRLSRNKRQPKPNQVRENKPVAQNL